MFKYLFFSLEEKPFLCFFSTELFFSLWLDLLCKWFGCCWVIITRRKKKKVWQKKKSIREYVYLFDVCLTEMKEDEEQNE
jgi:hypothetical protein